MRQGISEGAFVFFSVRHLLVEMLPIFYKICIPQGSPLAVTNFHSQVFTNQTLINRFWVREDAYVYFPGQFQDPHRAQIHAWTVNLEGFVYLAFSIPSHSHTLSSFSTSEFLRPKGEGFDEQIPFRVSYSKVSDFLGNVWLQGSICPHLLQEQTSLIIAE